MSAARVILAIVVSAAAACLPRAGFAQAMTLEQLGQLTQAANLMGQARAAITRRDLPTAVAVDQSLERLEESLFGPEDPETAKVWNSLAELLEDQGQPDQALDAYRHAFDIFRSARVVGDPDVQEAAFNVVRLLRAQGRFQEATAMSEAAKAPSAAAPQPATTPDTMAAELTKALATNPPLHLQPTAQEAIEMINDVAQSLQALTAGHPDQAKSLADDARAIADRTYGKGHPVTAMFDGSLTAALQDAGGQRAEAIATQLAVLKILQRSVGAGARITIQAELTLSSFYARSQDAADAERYLTEAVAQARKLPRETDPTRLMVNTQGLLIESSLGRYEAADGYCRELLRLARLSSGAFSFDFSSALDALGTNEYFRNNLDSAEAVAEAELEILKNLPLQTPDVTNRQSVVRSRLGVVLMAAGRLDVAEQLLSSALDSQFNPDGTAGASATTVVDLTRLGQIYRMTNHPQQAIDAFSRAIVAQARGQTGDDAVASLAELSLADLFAAEADEAASESDRARLLAQAAEHLHRAGPSYHVMGTDHPGYALYLAAAARIERLQKQLPQAEADIRAAVAINAKAFGNNDPLASGAGQQLGDILFDEGDFSAASAQYAGVCGTLTAAESSAGRNASILAARYDSDAATCANSWARALWAASGGAQAGAEGERAFLAAQTATNSAAAAAISRNVALAVAHSRGLGDTVDQYEAALAQRDDLDARVAQSSGLIEAGTLSDRGQLQARIDQLSQALSTHDQQYWDLRSPQPSSVPQLQADAAILHANEAVVVWMYAPGQQRGLVFAVSRRAFAWAQIGLTGDQLTAKVVCLRSQLDPGSYTQGETASAGCSAPSRVDPALAHNLYQALLGDSRIQAVLKDVDTLIVVPSGPLTTLPPGLLVVDPPTPGGPTHWLIRDKAIAVLPSVASLRSLRVPTSTRGAGDQSLLGFVDPTFAPGGATPGLAPGADPFSPGAVQVGSNLPQSASLLAPEEWSGAPPLPGTLEEGVELATFLQAPPASLVYGSRATKATVLAYNADGSLARARVLIFATHGVIAGVFVGVDEPGLLMARPSGPNPTRDGWLLSASDVATLKIQADWVILSACDTAAPGANGGDGLSGLARSFFYAGGRTLLVTHWLIFPDQARRTVTDTFRLLADPTRHLTKAQALQQAQLELMSTDPDPTLWAPFVLVGDPS